MAPNEPFSSNMQPALAGSRVMVLGVFLLGLLLSCLLGTWLTPAGRPRPVGASTVEGFPGAAVEAGRHASTSERAATWRISDAGARSLVKVLMEHARKEPSFHGIHLLAACRETGLGSRQPQSGQLQEVLSPPGRDLCVSHLVSAMTNLPAKERITIVELLGEGLDWNAFWLGRSHETGKTDSLTELVVDNATYFGNRLRESGRLARSGLLIVNGCNAGNWRGRQSMPKLLADAAGCLVLAPGGYTIGSFSAGDGPGRAETLTHIEGTRRGSWGSSLHQRQQRHGHECVETPLGIILVEGPRYQRHCEESNDDTFYLTTPTGYVWPAWLENWRACELGSAPPWRW